MIVSENLIIAGAVSVIGLFGGILGVGSYTVIEPVIEKKPRSIELVSLEYKNGLFTQEHRVKGADKVPAQWTAQIKRGTKPLCQGSGSGIYETKKPSTMDPNDWTDDDCPALKKGDVATATWEYKTGEGFTTLIGGRIVIEGEI